MSIAPDAQLGTRLTSRGVKTRARIVGAAADLMRVRGVARTALEEVVVASGVSKSQLYHHFEGKDALVRAVIGHVGEQVIKSESDYLSRVSTFRGLRRWRDMIVQNNSVRHGAYGCPLGSLASEVSEFDGVAREMLQALFVAWQDLLADALRRLQKNGSLRETADVDRLAIGLIAAVEGGYLLAQTARDATVMGVAIDMALDYAESLAPENN